MYQVKFECMCINMCNMESSLERAIERAKKVIAKGMAAKSEITIIDPSGHVVNW